jgi:hypothetical protein
MQKQRLICLKLTKRGQPGPLVFTAALSTVQIRCLRRPLSGWSYARYLGPGASSNGVWLYAPHNQRDDMTRVLRALQSAGGRVDGQSILA